MPYFHEPLLATAFIELRFQREKSIGKTLLHFFTRNFMPQNMLDIVEIPVKTLDGYGASVYIHCRSVRCLTAASAGCSLSTRKSPIDGRPRLGYPFDMRLWLPILVCTMLGAQTRTGPPVFEPNDTEGLVTSPNPAIRQAWKRKVFWKATANPPQGYGKAVPVPTPVEREQMTARLNTLSALLKATPTGSTGEGFWMNESRTLGGIDTSALPPKLPAARFPHQFSMGLFPFYHSDVLQNGQWRLSVNDETESVYFEFNRLPGRLRQPIVAQEDRGANASPLEFYLRPRLTAKWQGLPIYDQEVLIVARAGRDPWSPVTVGRVLTAALKLFEQDRKTAEDCLAGLKRTNDETQSPEYEKKMRETFEKTNGALRTSRPSNYSTRLASMERELAYNRQRASDQANP